MIMLASEGGELYTLDIGVPSRCAPDRELGSELRAVSDKGFFLPLVMQKFVPPSSGIRS